MTHIHNGIKISSPNPDISSILHIIIKSPKFTNWLDALIEKDEISFDEFVITDVDFFGPREPSRIGFIKGYAKGAVNKKTNDPIPGIVFIRGGSVAVLIIVSVKETGKKFILLCKQLRFPTGGSLIEAVAGMLDHETGNFTGVVAKELEEEAGIIINEKDLLSLGVIIPSGGGCDEKIHLYALEVEMTLAEFEEKQTKIYGEGAHERIQLLFYPYETFGQTLNEIGDVKAECCWRRYKESMQMPAKSGLKLIIKRKFFKKSGLNLIIKKKFGKIR